MTIVNYIYSYHINPGRTLTSLLLIMWIITMNPLVLKVSERPDIMELTRLLVTYHIGIGDVVTSMI